MPANRPPRDGKGGAPGRKWNQASRLLKDMRWVYDHPTGEEGSEIQKKLRQVLNDNPKDFFDRLQRAEAAHAGKKAVDERPGGGVQESVEGVLGEPGPATPDENEARVLGLIEDLLKGLGVKT